MTSREIREHIKWMREHEMEMQQKDFQAAVIGALWQIALSLAEEREANASR